MFSNITTPVETVIAYPISEGSLPFSEYITLTRHIIEERRADLQLANASAETIIKANCPFELYPTQPLRSGARLKYGVILIHGLLDSPFTMHDIGKRLQANGILGRAILLPGHGTTPYDLLDVTYHNWIQAVQYAIESMRNEVEKIYLLGYSTGATLSVFHALKDKQIAGVILMAPAIKIKAPIDVLIDWQYFVKWMHNNRKWIYRDTELDYTKYSSISFNAVAQVSKLTDVIARLNREEKLNCPVFMAVSHEDETISSHRAIDFFTALPNQANQLLLYTAYEHRYPDNRIITRRTLLPQKNIKHFSHVSLPFAPDNPHYGREGDFVYASHANLDDVIFGAYNHVEMKIYDAMYSLGMIKLKRRELTYNPDFDFMANEMVNFILR